MKVLSTNRLIESLLCSCALLACPGLIAEEVDSDSDGIPDAVELSKGYNPNLITRIVYVDANRPDDSGDGLSEAAAKKSIRTGLEAARTAGVENVVVVLPGTYTGADNRGLNFSGYNVKLTSKLGAAQTTVDLQYAGLFLSLGNGINATDSRIDGFTVKNGTGSYGGAIYLNGSAAIDIRNSIFRDNTSVGSGGAILGSGSGASTLVNCQFLNNRHDPGEWGGMPEEGGGALCLVTGTWTITNCDFIGNAAYSGGAVNSSYYAIIRISESRFFDNTATGNGGVFCAFYQSDLVMTNCLIRNNTADYNAVIAAYADEAGGVELRHCTIVNNRSRNNPDIVAYCPFRLYNSIFLGTFQGTPTEVENSCASVDFSAYGNNNFTADPKLTPAAS